MFMKFVIVTLFALNPRIVLWILRHGNHTPEGIKMFDDISEDYRYVTIKCACGKSVKRRIHGIRPIALLLEELMGPIPEKYRSKHKTDYKRS
jgi:hypothetical protein